MLKSAEFEAFSCIPSGVWQFSPGLNVIIGENGLGKSHVLKAIYSIFKAQQEEPAAKGGPGQGQTKPTKTMLEQRIAEELSANLRPDSLGGLVKRRKGRNRSDLALKYGTKALDIALHFSTNSTSSVHVSSVPNEWMSKSPVFIPTRELITLCPWFVSLYDNSHVPFEKAWRDTISLLGAPSVRGRREAVVRDLVQPIEDAMGGVVVVDRGTGRFYLKTANGKLEASLVAEGLRKFVMLARLVSTGVLLEQGYLFWDEPETNLNPKLIKTLASVIVSLAQQGVQTFIATHSLFLLREISIITEGSQAKEKPRYFALAATGDEEVSRLEQGDSVEDLQTLVLLDEELAQSGRYMEGQQDA